MSPVPVPTTLDDMHGRLLRIGSAASIRRAAKVGDAPVELLIAFISIAGLLLLFGFCACCAKVSETAFVCWKTAFGCCPCPPNGPCPCGPDVTMDDIAKAFPPPRHFPCCVDRSTTEERLERLEAWKNKELITQAAYDRRRAEVVALL